MLIKDRINDLVKDARACGVRSSDLLTMFRDAVIINAMESIRVPHTMRYNVKKAAVLLGVHRNTLARWIEEMRDRAAQKKVA